MGNLVTSLSGSSTSSNANTNEAIIIGNKSVRAVHSAASSLTCLQVQKLVASHTVVIISKSWCPYSKMAKEALANYKVNDLYVWEIDGEENSAEIQQCLKQMTGSQTVPR